ncbi:MAG: uroporphyrinogen-III C-methyltransferase [Rhodospirillales bacterium]|nr:MAG: uroporphyrinogen-III C-methyltransferase [Rhodospirillales bacterium]
MDLLPLFQDVKGRAVLVVGGGTAAARKAELVSRAGARVMVIAPALSDDMARLAGERGFVHRTDSVGAGDLAGCALVFAASEDMALNERVHELAVTAGVPVNVVDRPELCQFIMPAILDRDGVVVAVSSGGDAPLLTRMMKARFETLVPAAYGRLARFGGAWRDRVKAAISDSDLRRRVGDMVVEGPVAERVFSGRDSEAAHAMEAQLEEAAGRAARGPVGEVWLVGAGPGDPDLLTFRALRLMQQAEIVLYDRLIGNGILNLVRRDAERIYVGKAAKNHTVPQDEIGRMLVRLAREGKRVLRLKGGDPFIFGRGGEEIEMLAAEGIPFQVVPGITAASGCASYAGIPLTHRDHAQACVFVTGHGKDEKLGIDWPALIRPNQTIVIYMGLTMLPRLISEYLEHGGRPDMPAAIVEKGTQPDQRVVTGAIGDLPALAEAAGLGPPSLIIIGSVVTLRRDLAWYESAAEAAADAEPETT